MIETTDQKEIRIMRGISKTRQRTWCHLVASVVLFWIAFGGCDASGQTVEPRKNDAASSQANQVDVQATTFASREASVEIELAMGRGVLFTDAVRIDGRSVGFFLVDTGANVTVITPGAAKDLGIKPGETSLIVEGRDVGGIAKVDLFVGPLKITQHPIGIMDLSPLQTFSKPVVGILGADVLGKIPFTVDYREAHLILHDPSRFTPPDEAKKFDLRIVHVQSGPGLAGSDKSVGRPAVTGVLNGHELIMLLDTGLSRGVVIGRSDASKQLAKVAGPAPSPWEATVVGRQAPTMHVFEVTQLDVLGRRWQERLHAMTPVPPDDATKAHQEESGFSAVGGTLLREFRLTFDMPHKRLWVSPAALPRMADDKIEERNFAGIPPVVEAAHYGDLPMLKHLLARGASISHRDELGYNVLHWAAVGGCPQCAELLLSQGEHPKIDDATPDGVTPLILAAGVSEPEVMQVMLKAGADPNAKTKSGHTALHAAAQAGCLPSAKMLLKAGAKPGPLQVDGEPPMALAAGNGDAKMVKLLLDSGAALDWTANNGGSILHFAANGGNTDILQLALARLPKEAIDRISKQGTTPLMVAAEKGNVAFVQGLIDAGADATQRSGVHASLGDVAAIHYAAMKARFEVVQLLLQNSVPPDQTTGRGLTPLMLAAGVGDLASVKVLLKAGARVNMSDRERVTALHYAARRGQPAVVPLLIEAGAHVAAAADKGVRPLDFAAILGDKDVARLLVEAGADPMEKGTHGLSAVELAEEQSHHDLAGLLRQWARRSSETVEPK